MKMLEFLRSSLENFFKPKKGFGPVSAVLVTLGIYFGAQIIAVYLIATYADIRGFEIESFFDKLGVQFVFFLLIQALFVALLLWFVRLRQIKWKDIGLSKPAVDGLLFAAAVFWLYFIISRIVIEVADYLIPALDTKQKQQVAFEGAAGFWQLGLVFLCLVVIVPIIEEIMVRGFLYSGLRKKFSKIGAALIASAVFGLAHLQLGSGAPPLWIAALDTFVLSMVLIWLREKTGTIFPGMVVHAIKNLLAFLAVFVFMLN